MPVDYPNLKVLVVDDSAVMRKVILGVLLQMGFNQQNVFQAGDGEEGLAMAEHDAQHIILMDWNMPKMLGIDAVKAIREKGVKTPILMVTTEGERENVVKAIQAGANNYLVKPFNADDLREKIEQMVGV